MEKLFEQLIEAATKNRKGFNRLKHAVVSCQQYELAAKLREIEHNSFPETDEIKEQKKFAKGLVIALGMVNMKVNEQTAWLIYQTFKKCDEMKGEFSIDDAVTLMLKAEETFLSEEL